MLFSQFSQFADDLSTVGLPSLATDVFGTGQLPYSPSPSQSTAAQYLAPDYQVNPQLGPGPGDPSSTSSAGVILTIVGAAAFGLYLLYGRK
jgi:hypothetical protein